MNIYRYMNRYIILQVHQLFRIPSESDRTDPWSLGGEDTMRRRLWRHRCDVTSAQRPVAGQWPHQLVASDGSHGCRCRHRTTTADSVAIAAVNQCYSRVHISWCTCYLASNQCNQSQCLPEINYSCSLIVIGQLLRANPMCGLWLVVEKNSLRH